MIAELFTILYIFIISAIFPLSILATLAVFKHFVVR